MGERGPAPKPTRLRVLQGNPGEHRLNPNEPMPKPITPPPPPAHLHEIARELWIQVAERLCLAGLLSKLDLPLLEIYCESYFHYRQADDFIKEHGPEFTVVNAKGQVQVVREYPAVAVRRSCVAAMNKIGAELGLSPASRSKIPEAHGSHSLLD